MSFSCWAVLAASCVSFADAATGGKKNIVYIMADDLNADWKNDRLEWMPNLNKYFFEGGTEFKNHVAAQPVCGPSRSSMLLGRYPHNTGYKANSDSTSTTNYLSQHNNTVGHWLKEAGPPQTRIMTDVHQADFLGNFTIQHAKKAVQQGRPFFISVTPVMPHWGTCYGPGDDSVYPPYDPHWEEQAQV
eukprot:gene10469-18501_t